MSARLTETAMAHKIHALLFLACLILLPAPAFRAAEPTYTNPVIGGSNLADPTVLFHDGTYYQYPTGGNRKGYLVFKSKDLVHWSQGPVVFKSGRSHNWAPDVSYNPADRKFYLYYTADFTIGVAVADSPEGPFKDQGLRVKDGRPIDAHLFRDDDGKFYLYYTKTAEGFTICVQPMATPLQPKGEEIKLFHPTQYWECHPGRVNEGPWMLKHQGKYYLLYSGAGADWPDYAVGYAVADSPLGPFTKYAGNPIVHRASGIYGPGHGSVTTDAKGKLWHVYHQKVDTGHNFRRDICIDPLWFDKDGVLHSRVTRATPQPAPAAGD